MSPVSHFRLQQKPASTARLHLPLMLILVEPLSMFITHISCILWEEGQRKIKKVHLQWHIASEVLVALYSLSLSHFTEVLCIHLWGHVRLLDQFHLSSHWSSHQLRSWQIWGPTNMLSLILASHISRKIALRYWKHNLFCSCALVNCFNKPGFICSGGKTIFSLTSGSWFTYGIQAS